MFMGRVVAPGEPVFLPEDSAAAVALAEEERDTCSSCGLPKVWCRDNSDGRYRFDVEEEWCWATYRVASKQDSGKWKRMHDASKRATQLRVKFAKGHEPPLHAGLDIGGGAGG